MLARPAGESRDCSGATPLRRSLVLCRPDRNYRRLALELLDELSFRVESRAAPQTGAAAGQPVHRRIRCIFTVTYETGSQ